MNIFDYKSINNHEIKYGWYLDRHMYSLKRVYIYWMSRFPPNDPTGTMLKKNKIISYSNLMSLLVILL